MIRKMVLSATVLMMAGSVFAKGIDRSKERDQDKTRGVESRGLVIRSANEEVAIKNAAAEQAALGDVGGMALEAAVNDPAVLGLDQVGAEGAKSMLLEIAADRNAGMTPVEAREDVLRKHEKSEKDLDECGASMKR